jgi:uncharacterized membrane protein YccF (DUF307 family)
VAPTTTGSPPVVYQGKHSCDSVTLQRVPLFSGTFAGLIGLAVVLNEKGVALIGAALALIVLGVILLFFIPLVGIPLGIAGLVLVGLFLFGFGRRAAEGR